MIRNKFIEYTCMCGCNEKAVVPNTAYNRYRYAKKNGATYKVGHSNRGKKKNKEHINKIVESRKRNGTYENKNKLSVDFVKDQFSKEGYTLLSNIYRNNKQKLEYLCPNRHKHSITWNNWRTGFRCPHCSNKAKKKIEDIHKELEQEGYTLLSNTYNNSFTEMKAICPKGHIWKFKRITWAKGSRCNICSRENVTGEGNYNWKGGVSKNKLSIYDTYASQLNFCEQIRRNKKDPSIMEVTCVYCGKWYLPTYIELTHRIRAINGKVGGENRLYCSEQCKKECSIYNQNKYPKGFKQSTSREVQPELRQLVFKRDNYICQICDETKSLHCHHITGIEQNPIESADVDNCITLCKKCHKFVHSQEGCKYFELKGCVNE